MKQSGTNFSTFSNTIFLPFPSSFLNSPNKSSPNHPFTPFFSFSLPSSQTLSNNSATTNTPSPLVIATNVSAPMTAMKDEANANGENDVDCVIVWERWEKWPPCRRVLYSLDVCGRSIGWGLMDQGR